MRLCPLFAMLALSVAAGCTQFPDLDDALSPGARDASYPDLVPVERIRGQVPQGRLTPEAGDTMTDRVSALRLRADRLRGTVLDTPERARLQAGVTPL